jgi:hypothetical protein
MPKERFVSSLNEAARARPRRPVSRNRRRRGRGLLVFALIVLVLLVAVDRIGVYVAEREVAAKIQSSQHLSRRPDVSIDGFPFLTQVIGNHYDKIELSAVDLSVGHNGDQIQVSSLRAQLTGLRATHNFSGVSAARVTGTALISYAELSRQLGAPISYAGAGRIQSAQTVTVLGTQVQGTVSAHVSVPGGEQLSFTDVRVAVADASVRLPAAVINQLQSVFARQLSLAGLPFGLAVQQIAPSAPGVAVTATASNVALH